MNRTSLIILALTLLLAGIITLIPGNPAQKISNILPFLVVVLGIGPAGILSIRVFPAAEEQIRDLFVFIWGIFTMWEISFTKLAVLDPFLFPAPERVFAVFLTDYQVMGQGIFQSLSIILLGYFIAALVAIPSGLLIGWRRRIYNLTYPIAKAISPVPPTVYMPYAIVLLPSFYASSVFVIFIGALWPILVGTVYGVHNIDKRVINSARTLGLSDKDMMVKILLPAALPNIFSGALISLILSFVILTVAEMIGASSGLGWYIQYHSQFANYDRVIAGMILIVMVVIGVMKAFESVQAHSLRWQYHGE
ncbi:MAG TPA: ABC transporter permease [Methanospirillum sp.]|nr:ABC transporter permease [Methanospirillum sp.]